MKKLLLWVLCSSLHAHDAFKYFKVGYESGVGYRDRFTKEWAYDLSLNVSPQGDFWEKTWKKPYISARCLALAYLESFPGYFGGGVELTRKGVMASGILGFEWDLSSKYAVGKKGFFQVGIITGGKIGKGYDTRPELSCGIGF